DRIGRKRIVMAGCLLAALTYFPVFKALTHYANPALDHAAKTAPITVVAHAEECTLQFDPVGKKTFTRSCDVAKTVLAKAGVPYENVDAPAGTIAYVQFGTGDDAPRVASFAGESMSGSDFAAANTAFGTRLKAALDTAGYPLKANMAELNYPMVIAICTYLVILVTMVYGPIAAWLVELFPTRIRYTSMSLPYHIGNGWFGGFLPVTAFAIVSATGNIYSGLWYPVIIALVTAVIGMLFLRETKDDPMVH
ncbi:MAG TPA: MFS transporter, partial [Steroidobacteraceae bacterium]|nr:MFS transporter [Steroidobacteraceae bacterium]